MIILTEEYINEKALDLFNEAGKIQNEELRKISNEYIRQKIQKWREAAAIFEDDEFWQELIQCAEGDEEFMQKVELLNQCIL